MEKPKLQVEKRKIEGRKVKKLRREGILPANLYGKKIKSLSLQVPLNDFQKVYKEVGETGLVDLKIDSETKPVLIHNVQLHPVTGEPLHVDFHQVSLTEKTKATVPVEIIGESPAIEQGIGILIQPISEVEVEALPQDLPEHLVVDISKLAQVDEAITVADLSVDRKKVEIKADLGAIVAKIGPLEKEEVVPPPPPAEEAVPVEGEVPAEGAAPPEGAPAEEAKPEEKPASAEAMAGKPKEEKK
ncbi:MAG: 50S ribosomal protein L25 [Patescibacteria group bacterium]